MSFTSRPLDESDIKQIRKWMPVFSYTTEYNPGKFVMSKRYGEVLQAILDFDVREDDVFVASYLRTGSNWCQEIVWLIVNNLDFETSKSKLQLQRAPVIGYTGFSNKRFYDGDSVGYTRKLKSPRCIKSHEPYGFLPKQFEIVKPKLIYVMRNPKDVYCSYHSFLSSFFYLKATFEEAASFFCDGKMLAGDYLDHCLSYWKKRDEAHILFVIYEELLADTKKGIADIAKFLERPLTEDQVNMIYNFVKFDNLKQNLGFNVDFEVGESNLEGPIERKGETSFMRKGKPGDWKEKMTPEMSRFFDEWIERKTKGTELTFNFDQN